MHSWVVVGRSEVRPSLCPRLPHRLRMACNVATHAILFLGARPPQLLAPEATPSLGDITPAEPEYFITIEDGNFMNGCDIFFPSGWNQYVECCG